jgi:fibronectin type 3 domain-containing protein
MPGVTQYTVQRSVNGTTFGQIGTASGTSYTDTNVNTGTSYYYRISANGVNSGVIFTFAEDHFNMPTFAQRKLIPLVNSGKHYYRFAVTAGTEYTIEWQNGNNQNTPRYFYVKAYQNNGTQIFSRGGYYDFDGYTNPPVFTATATGFVTIEIENGTGSNQDYQIYCYGTEGTTDTGTVALPPYKVSTFRVSSPTPSSITLTWDAVSDAAKYNIYRANTQTGTPGKIGESATISYVDSQTPSGGSFWYTIAAVNADAREGCRFQGAFGFAASHYTLSIYSGAQTLSLAASGKHYYRLAVTQGQSYTIEWQDGNNQNAPRYFYVRAYQNNGTQIFSRGGYYDFDGYTNPPVFTATATGFVTIEIENGTGSSQNYQIYYY